MSKEPKCPKCRDTGEVIQVSPLNNGYPEYCDCQKPETEPGEIPCPDPEGCRYYDGYNQCLSRIEQLEAENKRLRAAIATFVDMLCGEVGCSREELLKRFEAALKGAADA